MSSCAATSATRRWSSVCSPSTSRARSSTSPPRAMSTAPFTARRTSSSTNVVGYLHACWRRCARYWGGAGRREKSAFRFLHVSTDEVYGSLAPGAPASPKATLYEPNSPYSASKAASDHLVRAWHHTYGLPVLTTNCSNNYGPYHFPEKLIPLMIVNALAGKPLPVYGDGQQVRDWLYVEDHCSCASARCWQAGPRGRDLQHRRLEREAEHRDRARPFAPCSTNCVRAPMAALRAS